MEYYSATKKNEVVMHATTWVNFENIIPKSQKPDTEVMYYKILFTWSLQNSQLHRDGNQISGCQVMGQRPIGSE
jgi:hypothetical protein